MMLKLISDWFDYIYYRSSLTYRFFKDDGNLKPTMVIVIIKAIFVIDVVSVALKIFTGQEYINSHQGAINSAGGMIVIAILLMNFNRYKDKFDVFHEKWKDESRNQRILKGFLVFFTFTVPWLPLIVKFMISNN